MNVEQNTINSQETQDVIISVENDSADVSEQLSEDCKADATAEEESQSANLAELESLRKQVEELTQKLKEKSEEAEKIAAQINDFYQLFPNTDIQNVPEEVWEGVKQGNSLVAAYAIYHRKIQLKKEKADAINARNASLSAGYAGKNTSTEYFTPDEVRAMSQSEVKANYSKIIESMKKWN